MCDKTDVLRNRHSEKISVCKKQVSKETLSNTVANVADDNNNSILQHTQKSGNYCFYCINSVTKKQQQNRSDTFTAFMKLFRKAFEFKMSLFTGGETASNEFVMAYPCIGYFEKKFK